MKVQWRNGSCSWISLSHLTESNPTETAKYAVSRDIDKGSAFVWYVGTLLKRRNKIIVKLKHTRIAKKNLK